MSRSRSARVAADGDGDALAGGRRERIVAHRQRGDLEPVGAVDARVARSEGSDGRETAVPGDVLLDAVGVVGGAVSDAQAHERATWRQVATEQLPDQVDRAAPGDLARPDADQSYAGR